MLVKLAFLMQRLKKYLKKFCHDQQRWGGTAVMTGDIELIGVPPVPPPPTKENPKTRDYISEFQ